MFSNIIKHSQATKVNIQIPGATGVSDSLLVEFDNNNNNNNGIGINNIKRR